ncbi:PAS domain-containing protein [Ensifer adhaerens]|uniref:PAS domain-containing protein n=1 Tax=Ensifer adhaerens TaxID=106592 RepID=A0A9Q8YES9_ENSAD|nr:PAS domain-containing protein [Ensifer adhaerens]USJ27587.1 PAS domain-containing protein [Ensifer adhaerens]
MAKDRPFCIEGHGYPETVQFDISYSPVRDEERRVRGVLCIVNDTTDRLFKKRWLNAARVLRWGAAFCEKI